MQNSIRTTQNSETQDADSVIADSEVFCILHSAFRITDRVWHQTVWNTRATGLPVSSFSSSSSRCPIVKSGSLPQEIGGQAFASVDIHRQELAPNREMKA